MSMSRQMQENIAQFCSITGASAKDAKRMLERHKRLDAAVDAFYSGPTPASPAPARSAGPSTSKITTLFDKYKDPEPADPTADMISIDGTLQFCADLDLAPEDVLLLALAYELHSPRMGEWPRKGWIDGWKALGVDSIAGLQSLLPGLRTKLSHDAAYFAKVYQHTFEFGRSEGQRSLAIDTAKAFWEILLPTGLDGGALSHTTSSPDDSGNEDEEMDDDDDEQGWSAEHTQWWFDFLTEKGGKGVSKDTWAMFLDFVRTIDSKFEKYDMEAAWPSTIDDFVEYAKERIAKGVK